MFYDRLMVQIENPQWSTLMVFQLLVYNSGLCFLFGQFAKTTTTKRKPEYLQVKSMCASTQEHKTHRANKKEATVCLQFETIPIFFFLQYSENRHRDCYNLFLCYWAKSLELSWPVKHQFSVIWNSHQCYSSPWSLISFYNA